jgi:hypothetical protein
MPWFGLAVDLVRSGQSTCSGIIEAMMYEQLFQGNYRARQSIEAAITENMLVSVRESVMRGVDRFRTEKINHVLKRSIGAMVIWPSWSDSNHAPWSRLAVGDGDFTHQPFCGYLPPDGTDGGGDSYQVWSSFAYGYELTNDLFLLQRAEEMIGGPLHAALNSQGLSNLENRAALLALVQQLNY